MWEGGSPLSQGTDISLVFPPGAGLRSATEPHLCNLFRNDCLEALSWYLPRLRIFCNKQTDQMFILVLNICCLSTIVHRTLDGCTLNSYNPICSPDVGTHQNGEGPSRLVGRSRTAVV